MAKRSRPKNPIGEAVASPKEGGQARKRLQRLDGELAELRALEAKRVDQLKTIRATAADVRSQIADLRAVVANAARGPGSDAVSAGPMGYCLRDKRQVEIGDPMPVTLSNGRRAIAGTCPLCDARVTVLAARPAEAAPA